jgi:hypothetical protein
LPTSRVTNGEGVYRDIGQCLGSAEIEEKRRAEHVLTIATSPELVVLLGTDSVPCSFVKSGHMANANLLLLDD